MGSTDARAPAEAKSLPAVDSCTELTRLLEEHRQQYGGPLPFVTGMTAREDQADGLLRAPAPESAKQSATDTDYSATNVQVQGVDEADVVKTDGKYIYQVNRQRVLVIRAYPAGEMAVQKVIQFADQRFNPREIFVDDEHLVVVGTSQRNLPEIYPGCPYPSARTVRAVVFDIRDKADIRQVREVELEGEYVSSRKVDKSVYLVANKYPDYYLLREAGLPAHKGLTPSYRDSLADGGFKRIACTEVCYFPNFVQPSYLLVAGFNLDDPDQEVEVGAYLGAGENIYASRHNLYVGATERQHGPIVPLPEPRGPVDFPDADVAPIAPRVPDERTTIYRFALADGRITFNGRGEVPGTVLNQFSMDEYNGYFRLGTTVNSWTAPRSRNSLYVLDENLDIVGRIEDIAPGERIYSVRFMGDRGYMVTFETVDPLFVFDLTDPRNPTILGALKIPGYSNYLHPYDEHHLIGFGKDAVEAVEKQPDGTVRPLGFVYEQGMKVSLFDVTDVTNPVEKFVVRIGDRGTDSELLRNHKALLFDWERNLLAFPVTVADLKHRSSVTQPWEYGAFAFQGAYVYELTLEKGFEWKGGITHLTTDDYLKAGYRGPESDRHVQRILYIGENLYTLSNGMVKANDMTTLAETGGLNLP
ncbi:MAG: beta-propeller domain-containing protein [Candidatus Desulforudis sp.]|nr:beta-propeller domain-containing protein [Desulforudis sp.]